MSLPSVCVKGCLFGRGAIPHRWTVSHRVDRADAVPADHPAGVTVQPASTSRVVINHACLFPPQRVAPKLNRPPRRRSNENAELCCLLSHPAFVFASALPLRPGSPLTTPPTRLASSLTLHPINRWPLPCQAGLTAATARWPRDGRQAMADDMDASH